MATAAFAEEVKDKTREELVESLFKVVLELRISMALKAGRHVTKRLTSATEKFKQKVHNTAREDILLLYVEARKKLDNEKAEDSEAPRQKKRKDEAAPTGSGLVRYLGDIVKASLGPLPNVCQEQVLLDMERVRMSKEDLLSNLYEIYWQDEAEYQYRVRAGLCLEGDLRAFQVSR